MKHPLEQAQEDLYTPSTHVPVLFLVNYEEHRPTVSRETAASWPTWLVFSFGVSDPHLTNT